MADALAGGQELRRNAWFSAVAVACIVASSCSDPDRDRLKQTTKATYDQSTGRLKELTYDAADEDTNHDGKRDKWETYEAGALKTAAFDEDHDGRPDRRLTYAAGTLTLIESEPDASGTYTRQLPVR